MQIVPETSTLFIFITLNFLMSSCFFLIRVFVSFTAPVFVSGWLYLNVWCFFLSILVSNDSLQQFSFLFFNTTSKCSFLYDSGKALVISSMIRFSSILSANLGFLFSKVVKFVCGFLIKLFLSLSLDFYRSQLSPFFACYQHLLYWWLLHFSLSHLFARMKSVSFANPEGDFPIHFWCTYPTKNVFITLTCPVPTPWTYSISYTCIQCHCHEFTASNFKKSGMFIN